MQRNKTSVKNIIAYSLISVFLFFISLEGFQRARYFLRYNSTYWLLFGFVKQPPDYARMLERGVYKKTLGIDIIEIPTLYYDGYRKLNPDFTGHGYYKVNSYGLRGKEFELSKKTGIYRIITLGGSTTFGAYVRDGYTYPDFLENILNSGHDNRYEVINAGIGAMTIEEIKKLFECDIVNLKPDMIIINSVFNNLYFSKNTYNYRANFAHKINHFLLHKSLFYLTLSEKMSIINNTWIGDIYKAPLQDMINNFLRDDNFWGNLKNNYVDIIDVARGNRTEVIIIKEPIWLRDGKKEGSTILLDREFEPVYIRAYELLDEIEREKNVYVIDAAHYFELLSDREEFFTEDGLHLREKGNEYMAELVAKEIITLTSAGK